MGSVRWTVRQHGAQLLLDREEGPFELPEEGFACIQPVAGDVRDVLFGADYVLTLSVGNLPDDASTANLEPTGLKWPERSDA